MTAMNIVHMRVRPGQDEAYLALHRDIDKSRFNGMRAFNVVKTGDRTYCVIGEWESMDDLVAARPAMIANLDRMRPLLEDMGGGRGVTEPWSGPVELHIAG